MRRRDSEPLHLWLRFGYRPWARLLHRFNLHHSRTIGPMEDGCSLHRCEWCGMSRKETPMYVIEARMREGKEAEQT